MKKLEDLQANLTNLDFLIRQKSTGDLEELAQKLGVSQRSVSSYLEIMRDYEADIKWDRYRRTYYYATEGKFIFKIGFEKKEFSGGGGEL
ncbi:MAG: hypothetical protein OHK0038_10670 [Flammeovirgaceae bacterium]